MKKHKKAIFRRFFIFKYHIYHGMVLGIYVTFLDAFGPKFWVEVGCLPIHHCRHNSRKCHHWRDHWVSTKENFYWKERFLVMISRKIRPFHFPSLKLEQKERSWVLYFLSKRGWGWLILTSSYVLRVMSTLKRSFNLPFRAIL